MPQIKQASKQASKRCKRAVGFPPRPLTARRTPRPPAAGWASQGGQRGAWSRRASPCLPSPSPFPWAHTAQACPPSPCRTARRHPARQMAAAGPAGPLPRRVRRPPPLPLLQSRNRGWGRALRRAGGRADKRAATVTPGSQQASRGASRGGLWESWKLPDGFGAGKCRPAGTRHGYSSRRATGNADLDKAIQAEAGRGGRT